MKTSPIKADTRQVLLCSLLTAVLLMSSNPASAGRGTGATELDRVAYAVEGAESSHGANPGMWRAEPAGPQGPMQASEKAAADVGDGDRFDFMQNRLVGRSYLGLLYRRYGNWADAISAYNWGSGRVDARIKEGRPGAKLLPGVAAYVRRVLHESGTSSASTALQNRPTLTSRC